MRVVFADHSLDLDDRTVRGAHGQAGFGEASGNGGGDKTPVGAAGVRRGGGDDQRVGIGNMIRARGPERQARDDVQPRFPSRQVGPPCRLSNRKRQHGDGGGAGSHRLQRVGGRDMRDNRGQKAEMLVRIPKGSDFFLTNVRARREGGPSGVSAPSQIAIAERNSHGLIELK